VSEPVCLRIAHDFRGQALPAEQHAELRLSRRGDALQIELDAPYFGDPAPAAAIGACDRLWEYEVCELFIADAGERYLEVELSPHGHHLVLELDGVRRVVRSGLPISYRVALLSDRPRYHGLALVPLAYLPARASRANAYAIHGVGAERVYCAHRPPGGHVPDFHRLESFVPLTLP
jgi:hypothetical protein